MLPSSHPVQINPSSAAAAKSQAILADAFSDFISASSQLEASYRDLQHEVAYLGVELGQRNAALKASLDENDRIRIALQQIIASMPCGVLVTDSDEAVVIINPEGRRLLELQEVAVGTLRDLFEATKVDFDSLALRLDKKSEDEICLATGQTKRWIEVRHRELSCAFSGKQEGQQKSSLQSVWILRDVTARKQDEEARERGRNCMALAETASILAHEIRNPLASLELFAGLISEDPDHAAQWVSNLRAGIRQLSGTVNNVLNLESGAEPQQTVIHLGDSVARAVEFAKPIAEQAGVLLSYLGGDPSLVILGNESMLSQIILNLIGNSIRHTPASGAICVSVYSGAGGGTVPGIVDITDTGCGIPKQDMERIFDAGFSASGDTPGLGLAVCRKFMSLLGGSIGVSSEVDRGTTFRLEFPTL